MGVTSWVSANWFEFVQTGSITTGLLFSTYSMRRDEQTRRLTNLNAIKQDYIQIWNQVYERPELARVLDKNPDTKRTPVSTAEWLFIKLLILHLDSVHRAVENGLFVNIEGIRSDVREFFSCPIPNEVWQRLKPMQDREFVAFVESALT